jgi:hypothetical protein
VVTLAALFGAGGRVMGAALVEGACRSWYCCVVMRVVCVGTC